MSTTLDYVNYVCEQIDSVATRYRKMFGEYMVYINEKPILLVCDNVCYVRMHPSIEHLMKEAETGMPYKGAKPHYILDIDHAEYSKQVLITLEPHVNIPKRKNKKLRKDGS